MGESLDIADKIKEVINANAHLKGTFNESATMAYKLKEATKGYSTEALKMAISQSTVNEECIRAMLLQSGLEGEVLETTVAELAQITSTNALSVSQKKATLSTTNLGTAMKGLGSKISSAFTTHPYIAIIASVLAIGAAFYKVEDAVIKTNEELKEFAESKKQELQEVQSEVDSLNSEIETSNKKIDELMAKENLSLVEEGELNKLREQNSLLEAELRLQQQLLDLKKQESLSAQADVVNKSFEGFGWDKFKSGATSVISGFGIFSNLKNTYNEFKNDTLGDYAETGLTTDQRENNIEYLTSEYLKNKEEYENAKKQYNEALKSDMYLSGKLEKDNLAKMQEAQDDMNTLRSSLLTKYQEYYQLVQEYESLPTEFITSDMTEAYENAKAGIKEINSLLDLDPSIKTSAIEGVFDKVVFEGVKDELVKLEQQGSLSVDKLNSDFFHLVNTLDQAGISVDELYQYIENLANPDGIDFEEVKNQLFEAVGIDGEISEDLEKEVYDGLKKAGALTEEGLETFLDIKANVDTSSWDSEDWIANISERLSEGISNAMSLESAKGVVLGYKDEEGNEFAGLIDEIELLQEVLADTGNISQETYEKLLSCSKDYATAIRTENGRITLNTTKLKQVAKQRQLDTKATIKETLAIKKQEWLQWKNKIENYNGTLLDSIETKYNDIDALQAEIAQYELLVNSLDNATSAFERFKAAQSTDDQDMYNTAQDAFNVLKEYSSDPSSENYGKYNTDEFQESAMLLMDSETYKKALNAKDLTEYQKVVNGFVKSISPLFDENNAKSASNLFNEVDKIIASGDVPIADQDWADRLGISKEAFNALKQLANLYDYNNKEVFESFPLDKLDDYQEKLSNVVAEKKALNEIEDKSSNEYLKQEQSLKQAEEKYNSFLQNNAETMTNAFANYSKTNGLINGENVTFADYVKEQFDFEDTDIQGSTLALIDQADKLQSKLNTITSDKNAQKQFAEYDQLQLIIGALSAMGFEYENVANNKEKFNEALEADTSKSRTKALESDMESLEKLQEQEKKFKEQMATSTYGSEMYAEAQAGLAQVQSQLQGLKESLKMKLELDISDVETKLQKTQEEKTQFEKSNAGLEGTMFYTSQMNSYNEQIERDTATKNELEKTLEVIVEDEEALGKLNELDSFEIAGKEFAVTAIDSATSVVESVNSMKIADKNFKITASVGVSQVSGSTNFGNLGELGGSVSKVVSDAASKVSGFGGAYGTANISGHAYADGNIGTNQDLKNVMVGEVAPEMVVDPHSGEYTIYQNPTMLDKLPKNAIIFNGKQTEEILKNGMTTSFGKAYVNGNVTGKAFGNGNGTKVNLPNFNDVKSNNNAIKNTGKEVSDTIEDTTEDVKEASEEIFDWIERRIQKFQRLFDKWLKQAETAITSGFVTKYYKKATSSLTSLLKTQAKAYTRYMEEANKVGLPEEYAKKVRNGTIDIESVTDETLKEQISKYQEWCIKYATLLSNE